MRISLPDYRCEALRARSIRENGKIVFDWGEYKNGQVIKDSHVWFPIYESVKALLDESPFEQYEFLHYYDKHNKPIRKNRLYKGVYRKNT